MHAKVTGTRSLWRRRLALAAGAILLLAQSVGAAHYHPLAFAQHPIAAAAASDSLCALCLHHQHAPSVSAAPFPLAAPSEFGHRDSNDFCFALISSFDSHLFGRAPPISV
jgi:hypothetical protein